MTAVDIRLNLPDDLARDLEAQGLLQPKVVEALLRSEAGKRGRQRFFETMDRLHALGGTPMTEEEIEAEITAARKERRAAGSPGC